jgi:hypothetical protein
MKTLVDPENKSSINAFKYNIHFKELWLGTQKGFIKIKVTNKEYIDDVQLTSICSTDQHCFVINSGAFLKFLISAKVWATLSFTTISCSQTLVIQTGIAIHHIPLYRNGYMTHFRETNSVCFTFLIKSQNVFLLAVF